MKKLLIILVILPGLLMAGSGPANLIAEADSAYNKGLFNEAAARYEKVIETGWESPALYYNLGNTYFKLNDLPSAILYYEKARVLAPRDKDIQFNLAIANSMIIDKIEAVPEIFYVKWWKQLKNSFNLHTWTIAGIVLFSLLVIVAGIFFLSVRVSLRKISFWSGIVLLLLAAASFSITYSKYRVEANQLEAIVFHPTITVKSSPGQAGKDLFVIHEGTKVYILDEHNDWCNIRIANGSAGWLPAGSIKRI